MFKDRTPSIGEELKNLEGENLWTKLSSLKEQRRILEESIGTDNPGPDITVDIILLTRQIEEVEDILHYKKAA
jgi:hypothetical protein